jgi:tRNA nucleotidyltransferase/poly(A) polymerase
MSDYMFMLESHLTPAQNRVAAEVQSVTAEAGISLFLAGGAMRDMLGGFPIRDLDFTIEGNPVKLAKAVAARTGAAIADIDDLRKRVEMRFPGGVTAELSMARTERYLKPGAKPHVTPATIHEDLKGRDFTINSIALSLSRASRGLLIDPTNGLGDLERRELRAASNYCFYDDPSRVFRLIRLRARLRFEIEERTRMQYVNAREAGMLEKISPHARFRELRQMAGEPAPADLLKLLDEEGLLALFCPALAVRKLNVQGLQKLQKAKQLIPFGVELPVNDFALFLDLLGEELNARERMSLIKCCAIDRPSVQQWQKLEPAAKKLERELKSAKLQKPSQIFNVLASQPGEKVLHLLIRSEQRLVHDRIKNFLQKYLPAAQEVSDAEVTASSSAQPGTPKFKKAKAEAIAARLDARPRKQQAPLPEEPAAAAARR